MNVLVFRDSMNCFVISYYFRGAGNTRVCIYTVVWLVTLSSFLWSWSNRAKTSSPVNAIFNLQKFNHGDEQMHDVIELSALM